MSFHHNEQIRKKPTKAEKERELMYREIRLEIKEEVLGEQLKMAEERAIIGCMKNLAQVLHDFKKPRINLDMFEE